MFETIINAIRRVPSKTATPNDFRDTYRQALYREKS